MLTALILAITHALALTAGAWYVHRRYLARLRREAARVVPTPDVRARAHRLAERARVSFLKVAR